MRHIPVPHPPGALRASKSAPGRFVTAGRPWPLPSLRSGRLTRCIPAARPAGPLATLVCPNRLSCRFVALQIYFLQICPPRATILFKDLGSVRAANFFGMCNFRVSRSQPIAQVATEAGDVDLGQAVQLWLYGFCNQVGYSGFGRCDNAFACKALVHCIAYRITDLLLDCRVQTKYKDSPNVSRP